MLNSANTGGCGGVVEERLQSFGKIFSFLVKYSTDRRRAAELKVSRNATEARRKDEPDLFEFSQPVRRVVDSCVPVVLDSTLSYKFPIPVYFFVVYSHCEIPKLISKNFVIFPFCDIPKLKLTHIKKSQRWEDFIW